jgi:NAD(P)-dependent dehydrogenase (short-subunit alcohol dehydrogenase family)
MGERKSILVTGAASGIGRACVHALDERGWRVFAGVRREADARSLAQENSPSVRPVRLDVTVASEIEAVARIIDHEVGEQGFDALINNAGIVTAGPLEFLPPADLREQLEVNVIGPIALTQAMLPMLRAASGRVVFISSASARIALPIIGPYAASKCALEAFLDALRLEVRPTGVDVVVIQPGPIKTDMLDKAIHASEDRFDRLAPEDQQLYRPMMEAAREAARASDRSALPITAVVRTVLRALEARRPKPRYMVLRGEWMFRFLTDLLPDRWRDAAIIHGLDHFSPAPPGAETVGADPFMNPRPRPFLSSWRSRGAGRGSCRWPRA